MAKTYFLQFGFGDPRTNTGLAPTFLMFVNGTNGATVAPPSITETLTGSGLYQFVYGVTQPIAFLADGFTTGLGSGRYVAGSIDPADRSDEYGNTLISYGLSLLALGNSNVALGISGIAQGNSIIALGATGIAIGLSNIALGTTNVALGTTAVALGNTSVATGLSTGLFSLIGNTGSTFGSNLSDPTTVFGFLKRAQEMSEGNQLYTKATGVLDFYSRGSSTLLSEKTIADTTTQTTKS